jgi:hypothetical protein
MLALKQAFVRNCDNNAVGFGAGNELVHLQALTPLMTSLTLTTVCGICARSHHQATDDSDTFTISPVVGYLMVCVGLLCCAVPLLPGAAGDISSTRFFWYSSPFWFFAFTAAAFFFRYRVVVTDNALTYGAFQRRVVPFSEVIDFDVLQGRRSSELWIYLRTGKRLRFSGMLSDFDDLVGMVNSHVAGLPGPQQASPEKIRDQEKRKRDNRLAGQFMIVGMLVVAALAFILWRMQLIRW